MTGGPQDPAVDFVTEHGQVPGIGRASFTAATVKLSGPTRLVLCTDGLVQSRGEDIAEYLSCFQAAVRRGPGRIEDLCDDLLAASARARTTTSRCSSRT